MTKKNFLLLYVLVLFLVLVSLGGGLYFWQKSRAQVSSEEKKEESEKPKAEGEKSTVVYFWESFKVGGSERKKIVFVNAKDKSLFEVKIPAETDLKVPPCFLGDKIYYLTSKIEVEGRIEPTTTLYNQNIFTGEKQKIAVSNLNTYPRNFWLAKDGSKMLVEKVKKKNDEIIAEPAAKPLNTVDLNEEIVSLSLVDLKNNTEEKILAENLGYNFSLFAGFDSTAEIFYFLQRVDGNLEIRAVELKTREIKKPFPLVNYQALNWNDLGARQDKQDLLLLSPDEKYLIFPRFENEGSKKISVLTRLNARNGAAEDILTKDGEVKNLSWSPDSEKIVFTVINQQDEIPEIWLASKDGKNQTKIWRATDKNKEIVNNQMMPGGKEILYGEKISSKSIKLFTLEGEVYLEKNFYLREVQSGEEGLDLKVLEVLEVKNNFPWKAVGPNATLSDSGGESLDESSLTREDIINYLLSNLAAAIHRKPYIGEDWQVLRFAFPKKRRSADVYVTYDDHHEMGKSLLSCEKRSAEISCAVVGTFKVGDRKWLLSAGEDFLQNEDLQYLEKEPESDRFVVAYQSGEKNYFPYSLDQVREKQRKVSLGEEKFRRDPLEVAKKDLPPEFNLNEKTVLKLLKKDTAAGQAVIQIVNGEDAYQLLLEQLVNKDETGIWTLVSIEKIQENN